MASNSEDAREEVTEEADIERRFAAIARQWRAETGRLSSAMKMSQHPAYQEIISMGWPAVPLILKELQKRPGHWLIALHQITGEQPAMKPGDETYFSKAVEAWIEWGKERGLIGRDG